MSAVATASSVKPHIARRRLAVMALVVLAIVAYVFVAAIPAPLTGGSFFAFYPDPRQQPINPLSLNASDFGMPAADGSGLNQFPEAAYVELDGAQATLVRSVRNDGPIPIVITGVVTDPPEWHGLLTYRDARSGVPAIGDTHGCCAIDEKATWAASGFNPVQVDPGGEAVVAEHVYMSNCRQSMALTNWHVRVITIEYSILGFPHSAQIPVGPVLIQSPETCP